MLCPNCDTHNDSTARFCRICGTTLGELQPQQPVRAPVYTLNDSPPGGPVCPSCARLNPLGARYCVYCASMLAQPAMTHGGLQPAYAGSVTNVYVMPQTPVLTVSQNGNLLLSLLLRVVWFGMIGWWLGLVWTIMAWLFNLTIIGLPVGLLMLNAIPQVMTLQPRRGPRVVQTQRGSLVQGRVEHPFLLRAIWFFVVGWWASLIWMIVAWAFSATILLLPIAFWMFNRVPTITTLAAEG
jgi:uncharacterized membrane protein YccF (DUF307 family)